MSRRDEVVEALRSVPADRNGIGARLRLGNFADPLIVVQSRGDELIVVPDLRRDTGRVYRVTIDMWNDHYGERVNMVRDYWTNESRGIVYEAEVLDGYDVDSLERNYGEVPTATDGMWARPQFYSRRPMEEPRRVRRVNR